MWKVPVLSLISNYVLIGSSIFFKSLPTKIMSLIGSPSNSQISSGLGWDYYTIFTVTGVKTFDFLECSKLGLL